MKLKSHSGWFAAGVEVKRAASILSDTSFKLFVWMCLHADRRSGAINILVSDVAGSLRKDEQNIERSLEELLGAGICRRRTDGSVEIQDAFWPYERDRLDASGEELENYISSVKNLFLRRGCVKSAFTAEDRKLASEWHTSGISLRQVERAIVLGATRKCAALLNRGRGTPITTLHYFSGLISELANLQTSDSYWRYMDHKLEKLERWWAESQPTSESSDT